MARVTGDGRFKDRLGNIAKLTPKEATAALYAAGQAIEIDAEHSITDGSISGKGHVPSLPGEPPNADTRLLDSSIETVLVDGPEGGRVNVESNAPYAAHLEFGTSKMAERPYMRPAVERNRDKVTKLVAAATANVVRRKS
jgi:HK97 gp10 family phage protein